VKSYLKYPQRFVATHAPNERSGVGFGAIDDEWALTPAVSPSRHRDTRANLAAEAVSFRNEAAAYALLRQTIAAAGFKMLTLDRDHNDRIAEYSAFGGIYRFILRAVGDRDTAKAMFERYLAGELSEALLIISRQRIEEDRLNGRSKPSCGGSDAFNGVSGVPKSC
jgi:hypothetical protein